MKLRHFHYPNLISYATASYIQGQLVTRILANRTTRLHPPTPPAILTFQCPPTYTAGLRSNNRLSDAEVAHLQAGGSAEFFYSPRGGLTTFHGPGQLVAYPIVDLREHKLTAKCYVRSLEAAVIDTCAAYGMPTRLTENVGVWVTDERKICAIGVRIKKYTTSHGIALNVDTEMSWFERIVACGLEGKQTTSLRLEGVEDATVQDVARTFVEMMAKRLRGVDGVESAGQDERDRLLQIDSDHALDVDQDLLRHL